MRSRVLFVDDEPRVLQGLRRLLRPMRAEWDMDFVDSGREALQRMAEQPFDVLVTDMRMPLLDGAALLSEVKERHPSPVRIVLSGQSEEEAVIRSVGPSHQYLSKPCDPELLRSTVTRACALREIIQAAELAERISQVGALPSCPPCTSSWSRSYGPRSRACGGRRRSLPETSA